MSISSHPLSVDYSSHPTTEADSAEPFSTAEDSEWQVPPAFLSELQDHDPENDSLIEEES